jgi:hypothetical protein
MTPVKVKFRSPASPPTRQIPPEGVKDMSTAPRPIEKFSTAGSESLTAAARPTREEVELLAYQIYVERGGADGHDVDDWLQAEHELFEKYANTSRMTKAVGA